MREKSGYVIREGEICEDEDGRLTGEFYDSKRQTEREREKRERTSFRSHNMFFLFLLFFFLSIFTYFLPLSLSLFPFLFLRFVRDVSGFCCLLSFLTFLPDRETGSS